jgi:hypothetical protein
LDGRGRFLRVGSWGLSGSRLRLLLRRLLTDRLDRFGRGLNSLRGGSLWNILNGWCRLRCISRGLLDRRLGNHLLLRLGGALGFLGGEAGCCGILDRRRRLLDVGFRGGLRFGLLGLGRRGSLAIRIGCRGWLGARSNLLGFGLREGLLGCWDGLLGSGAESSGFFDDRRNLLVLRFRGSLLGSGLDCLSCLLDLGFSSRLGFSRKFSLGNKLRNCFGLGDRLRLRDNRLRLSSHFRLRDRFRFNNWFGLDDNRLRFSGWLGFRNLLSNWLGFGSSLRLSNRLGLSSRLRLDNRLRLGSRLSDFRLGNRRSLGNWLDLSSLLRLRSRLRLSNSVGLSSRLRLNNRYWLRNRLGLGSRLFNWLGSLLRFDDQFRLSSRRRLRG